MKFLLLLLSLSFAYDNEPTKDQICGVIGDEIRITSADEYNDRFMHIHNVLGFELLDANKLKGNTIFLATKRTEFQRNTMPTLEEGERYCFEGEAYYRHTKDDEVMFWVEKLLSDS